MRIALVHDDFVQEGGAENLFAEIAQIYKDAPVYTSLVDWRKLPAGISRSRVRPSFIQRIPLAAKFYKLLLPLYPLAFESFDLSGFDIVISSTTRFAKGIITQPKTVHICYLNSIPRFLYDQSKQEAYLPKFTRFAAGPILNWLKKWDQSASSRVDYYIANSQNVASQVKKAYGQNAEVVYPFADTDFFKPAKIHNWKLKSQNFYLIVSRLVRWKKIDIAIAAAQNLGFNLKIVGIGPDAPRLQRLSVNRQPLASRSGSTVNFLGKVSKEKLKELYQNAQALIVTQDEDFGISILEAQACATPVVAAARGGQKEIIKDKITGLFFSAQTPQSLEDAIKRSSEVKWNLAEIRKNAIRFSREKFKKQFKDLIAHYAK